MDLYDQASYAASRRLTIAYSTSFSKSITLFGKLLQPHIYAIYGLVRIADEVVDTYKGSDKKKILDELEAETYAAIRRGYSANMIVHAFAMTARQFSITRELIEPFFESMRMDLKQVTYTNRLYSTYIYGSAEVVGLMCLRVFVNNNDTLYAKLKKGAQALGSAYQKVNFLRDFAADYKNLQRVYFPGVSFETFDESAKRQITQNIQKDIDDARKALVNLPTSSRYAVELSLAYYGSLLKKLQNTPAETIKHTRIRVTNAEKAVLLARTNLSRRIRRA